MGLQRRDNWGFFIPKTAQTIDKILHQAVDENWYHRWDKFEYDVSWLIGCFPIKYNFIPLDNLDLFALQQRLEIMIVIKIFKTSVETKYFSFSDSLFFIVPHAPNITILDSSK